MFKAKTIMITDVITVKKDTTIYDSVKLMLENNITGLPVVSEDMDVLGVVSEKDILKMLHDPSIDRKGPISNLMTAKVTCFDEESDLMEIGECFLKNDFRRVPIVSQGKLVGIISRRDLIKFIFDLRQ